MARAAPRTRPKAEWAKLKSAYCRGEGSIADLAVRFDIPERTAAKRCTAEGWRAVRAEVGQKAESRAREKDVESVAKMLGRHRGLANRLLRLVEQKLDEGEQAGPSLIVGEDGLSLEPLSPNRLDVLSSVVARLIPVERLAAGIEPAKPVKPVELSDDAEIVFEIDAPPDDEAT